MKRYLHSALAVAILLAGGVTMLEAVRMILPGIRPAAAQARSGAATAPAANRAFERAYARHDKAAVASLLDPAFTWIDPAGVMQDREEVLGNWPAPAVTAAETGSATIDRSYGRVVLLHIHRGDAYALRVWVRGAAGWRLLHVIEAVQSTRPPERKSPAASAAVPSEAGIDTPCINPCRVAPFHPQSPGARAAFAAWLRLEDGSLKRDMNEWGSRVLPDCLILDSGGHGFLSKTQRIAATEKQKRADVHTNEVPPLVWAREFDYGDTVVMLMLQQSYQGPPYYATRVWVRRDGRFQLAASYHTSMRDVPSFTLYRQLPKR